MDRLTSMAVFVGAIEYGSFAEAGEMLSMSSQMAGRHVQALETHLGVRLIDRTTRSQNATEAGLLYYARCKAILAETRAADEAIQTLSSAPRGLLRVSAPPALGVSSIVPLTARFMRNYPEVEVDLSLSDRRVDLVAEGYDAAIRIGRLADSSLHARRLADYQMVVCAAPGYLAAHGTPDQPKDLTAHHCLGLIQTTQALNREWLFYDGDTEHRVPIKPRLTVNDARATHAAALAGMGVMIGPLPDLQDDLESGRLVRVLTAYRVASLELNIVYTSRHGLPKLMRFIETVAEAFPYRPG